MPESVWDYPRPPRVDASDEHVVVELGGIVVCDTRRALRVLETTHPPTYYLPVSDFADGSLEPSRRTSFCEFKGVASYVSIVGGSRREQDAGWLYPTPAPGYEVLRDHVALYPGRMDRCTVDDEVVQPQAGGFYGGWITPRVHGPFKGEPGTEGW